MPVDHPDFASPLMAGSNLLFNTGTFLVPAGGQLDTGAIDVSSYAMLFIQITNPAAALSNFTVEYFGDLARTNPVGSSGTWWKNGPGTINMFLAVQAPVMDLFVNNFDGVNRNMIMSISGLTNVTPPGLIYPPTQIAFTNTPGVAINGTAIVQAAPGMNCDALWFVNSGNAPVQGRLDMWNGAAWQFFAFLSVATLSQGVSEKVTLPFSDCRIVVTNISGGVAVLQSGLMAPSF